MNFKMTMTPTALTLTNPTSKAKLVLMLEGKKFVATKTKGNLEVKEANCLSHLTKFSLDMLNKRSTKPAFVRLANYAAQLKTYLNVASFRTFNNSMRRVMDNGTPEYFANHFYEGRSAKFTPAESKTVAEVKPKIKKVKKAEVALEVAPEVTS